MEGADERRRRLLASFAHRGLLAVMPVSADSAHLGGTPESCGGSLGDTPAADTIPRTKWSQPAWRAVPAVGEACAPQTLSEANPRQTRLVELAYAVPQTGDDACAAWVEAIWSRLGMGIVCGHARDLYERYCTNSNLAELKVGMIVAVPEVPYSAGGVRHGHVGLYAGDDMVMDCAASQVRRVPLDLWLSTYGIMAEPRWGWLALIDLGR